MTTPNLSAPPPRYTTIPSPSTPHSALPSAASASSRPQMMQPMQRRGGEGYQGERMRVRGRVFPDEMARERQQQTCAHYRVHAPDNIRPAQYADLTVTEFLRQLAADAGRIKDHRVLNTFPRDAPTWSQALVDEAKQAVGGEGQGSSSDSPMWDLEFIDSPWADAQQQFKAVSAHDQEWRRQVKSTKLEMEQRWKEDEERAKRGDQPETRQVPGTPGPSSGPAAEPSTESANLEPATSAADDSLVAPGSLAKKKSAAATGPKPPTLSKAAQQANARKLEEQRSAQQMTQELTRSIGRKRKAWMLGGGGPGAASPKTPTADLLSKKKRKLDGRQDSEGPPELTGSPVPSRIATGLASAPGSPVPLGKRSAGFTAAIPSGLNPHAKRVKSVAPEEAPTVKSETGGSPAPEASHSASPDPSTAATPGTTVYQFPDVPDQLTIHDVKTAYDRRLRRRSGGGVFKRVLEQRYEYLLLDMAKREHVQWQLVHAGGLAAAAAAAAGKKEVKPGTGLLGMSRKTAAAGVGGRS